MVKPLGWDSQPRLTRFTTVSTTVSPGWHLADDQFGHRCSTVLPERKSPSPKIFWMSRKRLVIYFWDGLKPPIYIYIHMYVCIYICMSICIYVYMYICIYVYMYICIYVYMYICIYVYMYICIYVYMYICIYVYMYICIYVYMYICIYVYMYICIYVYMYICIYVYMYICIYVYMYICIYVRCIFTLHYIALHITHYTLHITHYTLHITHYTSLHYITLHYTTLHYTTLYYITLHYTTLHYITLHYTTLHYITLHYITLHYITLHYIALHYITLHMTHYITLQTYIHHRLHWSESPAGWTVFTLWSSTHWLKSVEAYWTFQPFMDSGQTYLQPFEMDPTWISSSIIIFLVGGLVAIFYFPINIGFLIIPTDELIFFRGVAQPPTNFGLAWSGFHVAVTISMTSPWTPRSPSLPVVKVPLGNPSAASTLRSMGVPCLGDMLGVSMGLVAVVTVVGCPFEWPSFWRIWWPTSGKAYGILICPDMS